MIGKDFLKAGHAPTLASAFFYFDMSFMVWVLLGSLGVQIAQDLGLSPAQKGLMVALPVLAGAVLRIVNGVLVDRIGPKRAGTLCQLVVILGLLAAWLAKVDTYAGVLAVGLVLVGFLTSVRIDLMGFLFGDILAVSVQDIAIIYVGGIAILGILLLAWRPLLAVTVSPELAEAEGLHPEASRLVLMILMASVIAIAMKLVGVLLITSLLIIPAVITGSQWGHLGVAGALTLFYFAFAFGVWWFVVKPITEAGLWAYTEQWATPLLVTLLACTLSLVAVHEFSSTLLRLAVGLPVGGLAYLALSWLINRKWCLAMWGLVGLRQA